MIRAKRQIVLLNPNLSDLPLSSVNNLVVKGLVTKMTDAGLSAKLQGKKLKLKRKNGSSTCTICEPSDLRFLERSSGTNSSAVKVSLGAGVPFWDRCDERISQHLSNSSKTGERQLHSFFPLKVA